MNTLATRITARLDRHLTEEEYGPAADLAAIAAQIHQTGLLNAPIPEAPPVAASDPDPWPEGVTVATSQTDVLLRGVRIGFIMHQDDGEFCAYSLPHADGLEFIHGSLESAARAIIDHHASQAATEITPAPSPERSIERGRDDQREDEMRADFVAGAEALADRIEARS